MLKSRVLKLILRQAWNHFLSELPCIRVSPEFMPATFSCGKVDEVRCQSFLVPLSCQFSQLQHFRMGGGTLLPCRLQELCRPVRRAAYPGHVRGINHSRILDRQLNVLHSQGTNVARWVLV